MSFAQQTIFVVISALLITLNNRTCNFTVQVPEYDIMCNRTVNDLFSFYINTIYNVLLRYLAYVSRCYSLLSFYNELLFR